MGNGERPNKPDRDHATLSKGDAERTPGLVQLKIWMQHKETRSNINLFCAPLVRDITAMLHSRYIVNIVSINELCFHNLSKGQRNSSLSHFSFFRNFVL